MKKTGFLLLVVLLLSFSAVSAQTVETLDPTNLGDYFTWDKQYAFIWAMLANISMGDSRFVWEANDEEMAYFANYENEAGQYIYSFHIDETGHLAAITYNAILNDASAAKPTMEKIRDNYGLAEAKPWHTNTFDSAIAKLDESIVAANDKTICLLGYLSAPDQSYGMVSLVFQSLAYFGGVG